MCLLFSFFVFLHVPFVPLTFFLQWRQNICHVILYFMRCLMKENPVLNFKINTISYVVNFINFMNITLIYHITKQRVCETISIINMLTHVSKTLVWPHDVESFQGSTFCLFVMVQPWNTGVCWIDQVCVTVS